MNTPKTNELEKFLIESNASSDLGKFQRMTGHARQLETQVNELRDAIKIVEQQLDYGRADDALKSVRAILEKTK